jgi:hypothetical protein
MIKQDLTAQLTAALARLSAMEQERDVLRPPAENYNRTLARAEAAEARVTTLLAGLRTYGRHTLNCNREIMRHADDTATYLSEPCTCGFEALITAQERTE